jgi:DNA-binding transcriptional ArsR family regulator
MVERLAGLDDIFHSLSDPTRRDILYRVMQCELSVGELVEKYNVSFAAISKHLKVLEKAKLIRKRKEGKKYMVGLAPEALKEADTYLEQYRLIWEDRYSKLDLLLKLEEGYSHGQGKSNQRFGS